MPVEGRSEQFLSSKLQNELDTPLPSPPRPYSSLLLAALGHRAALWLSEGPLFVSD